LVADKLHSHSRKTLVIITQALLDVKRAVLSELAREIALPIKFKYRLQRIWRFVTKTKFDYQTPCQALIVWTLTALKDRKYLEITLDWTQIRKDHILAFSIPYHKRSIPLFWIVAPPENFSPNKLERECLHYFLAAVPFDLRNKLVFVADRGFGKANFLEFLLRLEVKFVIRVAGKVWIKTKGYQGCVNQVPISARRIEWLSGVLYRKTRSITLNLLLKYKKDDSWYLASNINCADTVLNIYTRRMTIEEGFRDLKDGLMFKRLRLSRADKVGKLLLAGVLAYLFALIIGSQAERHPELIQLISILPKREAAQKLLSIFSVGMIITRKRPSIKLPLRLVPEIL
jgi:hypothetical protein